MNQTELEDMWATRVGARDAVVLAAPHVPAALAELGLVGRGDRLVAFADDFAEAFAERFGGADLAFVEAPRIDAFEAASAGAESEGRLFWFVNSIGGYGLRVPDLRRLGAAAEAAGAVLVVDNTVASHFGCHPHDLGATMALEALDRVCGGAAPRKLVAASVARSQRKRRRVDARAEWAHDALTAARVRLAPLVQPDIDAVEAGVATVSLRMQMHMDRARAVAEYLTANEMVSGVAYPGLASHPDHMAATSNLLHGFGPAVEFELPESLSAGEFFGMLPDTYRTSPAGGAVTRVSAPKDKSSGLVRLFAGIDDPLAVAADIDTALRAFYHPTVIA